MLAAGCETPPRDDGRRFVMASDLEKAWRRATALAPEHKLALPFAGEHVAVIGTGLAAGVARAYAALREDTSQGRTDAPAPDDMPTRPYDRTLLLSHSGDEPAMIERVEWLRSEAILAIAVGAPPGSPLDELAGTSVPLAAVDAGDGVGGPEAAHALTAFAVLRHHLLAETAAADAKRAARATLPEASGVERWLFVGRSWSLGLAETAARACRRRGADALAGPPSDLAAGDLGRVDPATLVWWFDAQDATTFQGDDAPAVRTGALDPAAELVLALRLADSLG
jgi:hypothetical protein